jgi:hypothetical protein
MDKEDYVELFRKEFLKLNFALDSYKHGCKAAFAVVNSRVHITFTTGEDKDFLRYELGLEEAKDFLHDFKKKCIDVCAHIKKEAI